MSTKRFLAHALLASRGICLDPVHLLCGDQKCTLELRAIFRRTVRCSRQPFLFFPLAAIKKCTIVNRRRCEWPRHCSLAKTGDLLLLVYETCQKTMQDQAFSFGQLRSRAANGINIKACMHFCPRVPVRPPSAVVSLRRVCSRELCLEVSCSSKHLRKERDV